MRKIAIFNWFKNGNYPQHRYSTLARVFGSKIVHITLHAFGSLQSITVIPSIATWPHIDTALVLRWNCEKRCADDASQKFLMEIIGIYNAVKYLCFDNYHFH